VRPNSRNLGHSDAAIRDYYTRLAQHWRSMALLAEYATDRIVKLKTHDAGAGGAFILLISIYALVRLWAR
jgi:hypothetical protein